MFGIRKGRKGNDSDGLQGLSDSAGLERLEGLAGTKKSKGAGAIGRRFRDIAETRDGRFFLLSFFVCLALVPIYFFALHLPLQRAAQAYAAKAEQARGDAAAVMNFKNVHRDMEAYEKELAEHDARSGKALPEKLVQGEFLHELQQKALKSQVQLHKVVPSELQPMQGQEKTAAKVSPEQNLRGADANHDADAAGLQEMAVTVECEGSYFALLDFLRRLQQSERVLCLEESRIGPPAADKGTGGELLQCHLRLTAYAWPAQDVQEAKEVKEAKEAE